MAWLEVSGGRNFDVIDAGSGLGDGLSDEAHGLEVQFQSLRKLLRVSSKVSPAAAQPGTSGEQAENPVESGSITTA